MDYHIATQKVLKQTAFYTNHMILEILLSPQHLVVHFISGELEILVVQNVFFCNENKQQHWFTAEEKFKSNLVVLNSFFSDQEGWLFFLFERVVINSAK